MSGGGIEKVTLWTHENPWGSGYAMHRPDTDLYSQPTEFVRADQIVERLEAAMALEFGDDFDHAIKDLAAELKGEKA